jgi:hypothetical protein
VFTPRREHARFCSVRCRVAWNRVRTGDPVVGYRALQWSVPAMSDTIRQLASVDGPDRAVAFTAIHDAVWAVTIVDAALVRYHVSVYDRVLDGVAAVDRRVVEESLAGLRFLRNRVRDEAAFAQFVEPTAASDAGRAGVAGWRWRSVAAPPLSGRRARAREWEMARYRTYQTRLAGHSIGEVFELAEAFLRHTAEQANVITDIGA